MGEATRRSKPGGVRIGTAEVYRFAEEHPDVEDSLVIGDQLKTGKRAGDVRIVLFVKTKDDIELTKELENEIKRTIKEGASDAHVPALLKQVKKIPYTPVREEGRVGGEGPDFGRRAEERRRFGGCVGVRRISRWRSLGSRPGWDEWSCVAATAGISGVDARPPRRGRRGLAGRHAPDRKRVRLVRFHGAFAASRLAAAASRLDYRRCSTRKRSPESATPAGSSSGPGAAAPGGSSRPGVLGRHVADGAQRGTLNDCGPSPPNRFVDLTHFRALKGMPALTKSTTGVWGWSVGEYKDWRRAETRPSRGVASTCFRRRLEPAIVFFSGLGCARAAAASR